MHPPKCLIAILADYLLMTSFAFTIPPTQLIAADGFTISNFSSSNSLGEPLFDPKYTTIAPIAQHKIDAAACYSTIKSSCQILSPRTPRNRWIWNTADGPRECALARYLPAEGRVPGRQYCESAFEQIIAQCAVPQHNVGSVNVRDLPDTTWSGTPIEAEEMRFVMAPGRMTY